jgi:hypothetical protein
MHDPFAFQKSEGAGKAGARFAPIALRAKRKDTQASVTTGTPFAIGLPCANGFNGFLRALPSDRLSCHCRRH